MLKTSHRIWILLLAGLLWTLPGCPTADDDDGDDDDGDDDAGDDDTGDDDVGDDDVGDDDVGDDDSGDDDVGDDDTGDDDTDPYVYGDIPGHVDVIYAEDLACAGDHCYVAAKTNGTVVVDVSDVANPTVVDTIASYDEAWDVAIDGGSAFIADRNTGLIKVDLSNPAQPTVAWVYASPHVARVDAIATGIGGALYIGGGDGQDGAFEVLTDGAKGPTSEGHTSLAGEACVSLGCGGTTCFCGGGYGTLSGLDVSNPAVIPAPTTFFDAGKPGHEPWGLGVTVDGGVVYYADWGAGLFAVDASVPGALTALSSVYTADGFYDSAVAGPRTIQGTPYTNVVLGANAQGGLAVIDASDPAAMTLIGGAPLDVTVQWSDGPHGVWVMGKYAYLADNMEQTLTIVRIED